MLGSSYSYLDYLSMFNELGETAPEPIAKVVKNDIEKIKNQHLYIPYATIHKSNYRPGQYIEEHNETNNNKNKGNKGREYESSSICEAKTKKTNVKRYIETNDESGSESDEEHIYI